MNWYTKLFFQKSLCLFKDIHFIDGFSCQGLDNIGRQTVDKGGALFCCVSCCFAPFSHHFILHDLLDDRIFILCPGNGEENLIFPCRCNGNGDGFWGDLDKFHDRFDILYRSGEELFCQFDPGINEFFIRDRP